MEGCWWCGYLCHAFLEFFPPFARRRHCFCLWTHLCPVLCRDHLYPPPPFMGRSVVSMLKTASTWPCPGFWAWFKGKPAIWVYLRPVDLRTFAGAAERKMFTLPAALGAGRMWRVELPSCQHLEREKDHRKRHVNLKPWVDPGFVGPEWKEQQRKNREMKWELPHYSMALQPYMDLDWNKL